MIIKIVINIKYFFMYLLFIFKFSFFGKVWNENNRKTGNNRYDNAERSYLIPWIKEVITVIKS